MDDHQLLQAVQNQDPSAFDAFVERYGRRLLAFGIRMCGHREDAEDVFQETLLQAYKGLKAVRQPEALRTWLFRVASNQCLMKRRKPEASREISLEELKPDGWETGELCDITDWSTVDGAERAEMRAELERALLELPPDYKIVVLLRDVEGLTTQETAEVLGTPVPTVKMRLHRARMALRQNLAEYYEARRS